MIDITDLEQPGDDPDYAAWLQRLRDQGALPSILNDDARRRPDDWSVDGLLSFTGEDG